MPLTSHPETRGKI